MLIVLAHGRRMPSATVRALIFRPNLIAAGYEVTFADHYSDIDRYIPGLNRVYPIFSGRWLPLLASRCDTIYLCKISSLKLIQRIRKSAPSARLVLDFGDAIWLAPRTSLASFERALSLVDAVTTDNGTTAEYVRRFNRNCTVIPDCPQIEAFDRRRAHLPKPADGPLTIGWVGSPTTTYNLYVVWEALERLFAEFPHLHLRLLGADARVLPPFEKVRFSNVPTYDQARMVEEVLAMHIGLFPLQDTEASRVRGILKATVYMSGGAVPVCSPVGQSVELIEDGVNGMLAANTDDWVAKLKRLIADGALRSRLARNGIVSMREHFTVARSFELLNKVLSPAYVEA